MLSLDHFHLAMDDTSLPSYRVWRGMLISMQDVLCRQAFTAKCVELVDRSGTLCICLHGPKRRLTWSMRGPMVRGIIDTRTASDQRCYKYSFVGMEHIAVLMPRSEAVSRALALPNAAERRAIRQDERLQASVTEGRLDAMTRLVAVILQANTSARKNYWCCSFEETFCGTTRKMWTNTLCSLKDARKALRDFRREL